jgi:hypothetical protein
VLLDGVATLPEIVDARVDGERAGGAVKGEE